MPAGVEPAKWVKAVAKDLAEHRAERHRRRLRDSRRGFTHWPRGQRRARAHATRHRRAPPTPPPEATEQGHRRTDRRHARREGEHTPRHRRQPGLQRPGRSELPRELQKVATKIRLGLFHDQTSEACDWHLPLAHYLESWGDTETSDGTLCCVQPLIAPLNGAKARRLRHRPPPRGGRSALEVLSLLTQFPNPADGKPVDVVPRGAEGRVRAVRKVFADRSGIALTPTSSTPSSTATSNSASSRREKDKAARRREDAARSDSPRPIAKAIPATAVAGPDEGRARSHLPPRLLGLRRPVRDEPVAPGVARPDHEARVGQRRDRQPEDRRGVRPQAQATSSSSRSSGTTIEIPVYVLPGQADYSIALPFGQFGEMRIATSPTAAAPTSSRSASRTRCTSPPAARSRRPAARADLVVTQEHGVIPEGRDIVVRGRVRRVPQESRARPSTRTSTSARPEDRPPARRPRHRRGPQEGVPGRVRQQAAVRRARRARSRSGSRSTSPAPNCSTASSSGAW